MITINAMAILKWYSIILMILALIVGLVGHNDNDDLKTGIIALLVYMPVVIYLTLS